jgi:hypothetical protein
MKRLRSEGQLVKFLHPIPQIENEISSLLAGQFSAFDETELEAELEALVAEENSMESSTKPLATQPKKQSQREADLVLPDTPEHTPVILPDTPTHVPVETSTTETRLPTTA